jgi:hypothetical protein
MYRSQSPHQRPRYRRHHESQEYRLYKPKRLPDPPVHIPVRRNFHPVTSTLFILAWGLTGFFAVSALALYLAKGLPRWKQTAGFPKSEL